jgi:hypothetical protein
MGKQHTRNKPFTLEDYDDTTIPVRVATPPDYAYYSEDNPDPEALIGPSVQQYAPPNPQAAYPYLQPTQAAGYPAAPPARPQKQRNYPPGGAPYFAQPVRYRTRRSPFPTLVGLCFVLVQLVLLARALCLLFSVQATSVWLALLFAASDFFVKPLLLLVAKLNIMAMMGTQVLTILEFLVAALAYGILSRILVRILKALLNH